MDIKSFIKELEKLKPSEELLINSGFTHMPNTIEKNYVLDRKENKNSESESLIFQLFNDYDPQFLRFADYSFYKEIERKDNMFVFGRSSYSLLMFESPISEVIEKDTEEFSILNYCARDTGAFLKALLVIFEMNSLRFQDLVNIDNEDANKIFLERSVRIAGGERYRRFFKDIIIPN